MHPIGSLAQVFQYTHYREFLKVLYEQRKETVKPYSYFAFAEELGFAPSNVMRLVVAGKRKLARSSAQKIADALKLTGGDRRYFFAMIEYANAKSLKAKEKHFKQLIALRLEKVDSKEKVFARYFSAWYHPVIRELIKSTKDGTSAEELARSLYPYVAPEEVRSSLKLLQEIGHIVPCGSGFKVAEELIILLPAEKTASDLVLMDYHKNILDVAKIALDEVPEERRDFNAVTFTLAESQLQAIKSKIHDLCTEALMLEDQRSDKAVVVQLNVQFFSLTK